MKKILWIMALLLLAAPLPAARGEGFDDYLIKTGEPIAVCALSAHDAIVRCWPERRADLDTEPWHLLWLRDGKEYRHLSYYVKGATQELDRLSFLVREDGSFRVLLPRKTGVRQEATGPETGRETDVYRTFLYDWTDKGLENPVPLPEGWAYTVCSPFLAATRRTETDEMELMLYTADGKPLFICVLPGTQGGGTVDVWGFRENGWLIHFCSATRGLKARDLVFCVQDWALRWQVQPEEKPGFYFPDGRGGFFVVEGNTAGDYTPLTVTHYGGDGCRDQRSMLKEDRLVTQIQGATYDAQRDRTILYGYAVANSRQVYTAFALTLDAEQSAVSLEMRDVPDRYRDYSPRCYLAPDGAAWVYIWGVGLENPSAYPPALVPFQTLPLHSSDSLAWEHSAK